LNFVDKLQNLAFGWKILAFIILTIGYLSMGFSRLLMGVHSLNQIIYGYLLGLMTLLLVLLFLQPLVISTIK
jgi:membrane-associated phospholipid phosphatase